MKELTRQCENEDIAKGLLLATKDKTKEEQYLKIGLLEGILNQRKNLYIYPQS